MAPAFFLMNDNRAGLARQAKFFFRTIRRVDKNLFRCNMLFGWIHAQ